MTSSQKNSESWVPWCSHGEALLHLDLFCLRAVLISPSFVMVLGLGICQTFRMICFYVCLLNRNLKASRAAKLLYVQHQLQHL